MTASGNYVNEADITTWATLAATKEASTIAFVHSDSVADTITHSGDGLIDAGFLANMKVIVSGTTENDGIYTIASVAIGALTLISADTLTNESAGSTFTLDSGERQEIINRAEGLIENVTRDVFYAKVLDVYVDGNGNDRLFPGFYPDILSVSAVYISGIELDSGWYTFEVNSIYLDSEAVSSDADDLPELHFRLRHKHRLFPKGMGNIRIVGTYGWSAVPSAIKEATIILCKYSLDNTLYSKYSDYKSEKIGDYSYTRGDGGKYLTGLIEADDMVREYIRKKTMLSMV